jgi:hypothetical protein
MVNPSENRLGAERRQMEHVGDDSQIGAERSSAVQMLKAV